MNLEQVKQRIEGIAGFATSFKVGKSGKPASQKLIEDHAVQYQHIKHITWSTNPVDIDYLEKLLIAHYQNKYPNTCDNDQVGGGEMSRSGVYRIYVVYNTN